MGITGFALQDQGRARAERGSPQGNLTALRRSSHLGKLPGTGDVLGSLPALFSPVWELPFLRANPAEPSRGTQPHSSCRAVPGQGSPSCRLPPTHPWGGVSHYFWDSGNTLPFPPGWCFLHPPFLLAGCCWAELSPEHRCAAIYEQQD